MGAKACSVRRRASAALPVLREGQVPDGGAARPPQGPGGVTGTAKEIRKLPDAADHRCGPALPRDDASPC